MRIAVVIAKKPNGSWDLLAAPDVPLHEEKQMFKALKAANGEGKYVEARLLPSGPGTKRASFKIEKPAKKKAAKKD